MRTMTILILALVFAGFLAGWWVAVRRWRAGESVVPGEPSALARWGLVDFLLAFLMLFGATVVVIPVLLNVLFAVPQTASFEEQTPSNRALLLLGSACGSLATALLSMTLIRRFHNCRWRDLGWLPEKFWSDVKLGAIAFVMLAPVVYGLQIILVRFFESKHPLIELLKEQADVPFYLVSGFSAVLVAPLVEEYLFRVLLQGWLEKLAVFRGDAVELILGVSHRRPHDAVNGDTATLSGESKDKPTIDMVDGRAPVWPVFASSLLFALMHYSHGPDWIPLMVLALGLGYLYRQTHRIMPCIAVHFLLNACSLTTFVFWSETG